MAAILENPAIRARAHAVTLEEYHAWIDAGIAPPSVELSRGALVEQTPKSPLRASIVTLLFQHLSAAIPSGWTVRSEQPLTLHDSEPEPDLAVLSGSAAQYFKSHLESAALIIEVAISSEATDLVKGELYAEAGVAEYWLLHAEQRTIERHTAPQGTTYNTSSAQPSRKVWRARSFQA